MSYEIDKGIPVIKGLTGKWANLARRMEVGDSILVKTKREGANLCIAIRREGYKPVLRTLPEEGVRVWKLERG